MSSQDTMARDQLQCSSRLSCDEGHGEGPWTISKHSQIIHTQKIVRKVQKTHVKAHGHHTLRNRSSGQRNHPKRIRLGRLGMTCMSGSLNLEPANLTYSKS